MNTNLIFDIGAFEGQDTDFYLQKGFSVVAVEANPQFAAKIIEVNIDAIRKGRLTVVSAAVSESEGLVDLYLYETPSQERIFNDFDIGQWTSLYSVKPGVSKTISVSVIRPSELFKKFDVPYYLKIDIEGADIIMLRALESLQKSPPRYVSFEIGPDYLEALSILVGAGYSRFKLIEQGAVPEILLPCPSREGSYIAYQFTNANSGPFGEETPGEWVEENQIITNIEKIDWNATTRNGWKPWYDLHAAI